MIGLGARSRRQGKDEFEVVAAAGPSPRRCGGAMDRPRPGKIHRASSEADDFAAATAFNQ